MEKDNTSKAVGGYAACGKCYGKYHPGFLCDGSPISKSASETYLPKPNNNSEG